MTGARTHDHDHGHDRGHDHDHGHAHGNAHGHVHAQALFGRAFLVGIVLNTAYVLIEFGFGFASNSVALMADAGHNLSDVLGLVVAWVAAVLARRPPSSRYTYGLRKSSILAALFNAVFLLLAVGAIGWESIQRLVHPEPVAGMTVLLVAAIGIVVNGVTAWLFAAGRKGDLNIRGAYLHMVADAAVSAGVVAAGLAIILTGWLWIDPLVSLAVVGVITWGTWGLLRESWSMSMAAVPPGVVVGDVQAFLETLPGVARIHDLHIWSIGTTERALTCHVVMPSGFPGDAFLMQAATKIGERFGIGHTTLQIETDDATACPLAPDHVV